MSLTELTNHLSKTFDACLESILTDPQQKEADAESVDTHIKQLKKTFLNLENQLKEIRLKALSSKELSIQESNRLLKKDIDIKKSTIDKYLTKLENWEKDLPVLKENSQKALSNRNDRSDFDSDIPPQSPSATHNAEDSTMETLIEPANNSEDGNVFQETSMNMEDDDDDDDDVEFEEV